MLNPLHRQVMIMEQETFELATLGGGCFWCLEAVFINVEGVIQSVSGYAGGKKANPTYEQVCTGKTGHAEVVEITFDPAVITYRELLEIYFGIHDPTMLNRQGNDVGTQYRSVIFYHSPEQQEVAEQIIRELEEEHAWKNPIVTQVVPFTAFYRAEEYHQNYFANNPNQTYCRAIIAPKVAHFQETFIRRLKKSPSLASDFENTFE